MFLSLVFIGQTHWVWTISIFYQMWTDMYVFLYQYSALVCMIPQRCSIDHTRMTLITDSSVRRWDSWIQMFQQVSAGNCAQLRSFSAWAELTYKQRSEEKHLLIFKWQRGVEGKTGVYREDTQQHVHHEASGFILCGKPSYRLVWLLWVRWLSAKVALSPLSRQPWGQRGCMITSVCYITLTWWSILSWGLK